MKQEERLELERIGGRVRKIRREKSMAQADLAEVAGIAVPTLSRIENGTCAMSILMLKKLAGSLEVPIEKIVE